MTLVHRCSWLQLIRTPVRPFDRIMCKKTWKYDRYESVYKAIIIWCIQNFRIVQFI